MTYTTTQIREFCDAYDKGELEYNPPITRNWLRVEDVQALCARVAQDHLLRITPKPTPPVYEQWTDIKEVPLDHWYRPKNYGRICRRIGTIYMADNQVLLLGDGAFGIDELFTDFLHSPDPFAPESEWMICGRVK